MLDRSCAIGSGLWHRSGRSTEFRFLKLCRASSRCSRGRHNPNVPPADDGLRRCASLYRSYSPLAQDNGRAPKIEVLPSLLVPSGKYKDSMSKAVFSAYFDASGSKKEQRVLTVAGFVGRVLKWDRFNAEWTAILAKENVTAMHMTDFASSKGEFLSWKGQSERRRKLISQLAECIRRNTNKGFASSVILPDYREVNAGFMLSEAVGEPYTLCARTCLGALARWATKKRIRTEQILVAVEQGDEDQGELTTWAAADGFAVVPLLKQKSQAFQAGDMAGWKTRIALQNVPQMKSQEDRDNILRSLDPIRPIVQRNMGFDKERLAKLCIEKNIPKRYP